MLFAQYTEASFSGEISALSSYRRMGSVGWGRGDRLRKIEFDAKYSPGPRELIHETFLRFDLHRPHVRDGGLQSFSLEKCARGCAHRKLLPLCTARIRRITAIHRNFVAASVFVAMIVFESNAG